MTTAPPAASPPFDLVLAADARWGIGKDNALPWPKLGKDLRHFQRLTTAAAPARRNAVIMGRRTWESKEVQERALPRRHNLVITRRPLGAPRGGEPPTVAASLDEALAAATAAADLDQIFVIGGAEIYRLALADPRARAVYLTRIAGDFGCDTFVPDLDALCDPDPSWPAVTEQEHDVSYRIEKLWLRSGAPRS